MTSQVIAEPMRACMLLIRDKKNKYYNGTPPRNAKCTHVVGRAACNLAIALGPLARKQNIDLKSAEHNCGDFESTAA